MGTNDATIMTFTSRLRTELASSWVTSGKSADEIFTLLKLDTTGFKIFTTPPANKDFTNSMLYLYAVYLDKFNRQYPRREFQCLTCSARRTGKTVWPRWSNWG
ncbi:hypothetical protein GQ600_22239 [Phytophthora cactorum]|nr:hypothetical protein GQ600_22239 [Phytophthora cactorum]